MKVPGAIAPLRLCALLCAVAPVRLCAQLEPAQTARIDSLFQRFAGGPGCAVGVIQGDQLLHAKGYGLASVELGVPISAGTVFDLGSVSKQFTAMAIVLLAQDGTLSLDDEIQRFVPEVPRYQRPVTIRHLLHHTSGLRDYIDILSWSGVADEAVTGDGDALEAIQRQQAPNFPAGSEYRYSNSGYFLLSVVVKRASGESLRDFAARRIFQPLGMIHTQFVDRHDLIVPGKAGSYARNRTGFVLALANWEQTGDGAVNTTIEDMARWNRNFETGTVGGMAAIRALETVDSLNDGTPNGYAFGQFVETWRGVRRVTHGGAWAGFRAHYARYPDQHLSTAILCNLASAAPSGWADRVAEVLFGDKLQPTPPRPGVGPERFDSTVTQLVVPHNQRSIAGRYRSPELLSDWIIVFRDGSYRARAGLGAEFILTVTGQDKYEAFGTRIEVETAGPEVRALILNNRGLRNLRLERVGNQ